MSITQAPIFTPATAWPALTALPPAISDALSYVVNDGYYADCPAASQEISIAVCMYTLKYVLDEAATSLGSFLSYYNIGSQFTASGTSVLSDYVSQPAVAYASYVAQGRTTVSTSTSTPWYAVPATTTTTSQTTSALLVSPSNAAITPGQTSTTTSSTASPAPSPVSGSSNSGSNSGGGGGLNKAEQIATILGTVIAFITLGAGIWGVWRRWGKKPKQEYRPTQNHDNAYEMTHTEVPRSYYPPNNNNTQYNGGYQFTRGYQPVGGYH